MAGHVAELEAYRVGARALASRILGAQEAERIRVSRELHDETGQALTLLLVRLQLIENMTNDPAVRRELVELRALVVDTLEGVRRLAVQLGPSVLENLGLASALEWLVDRVRLGYVIDYMDVYWGPHHWPAFNVADSAITVGVALLVIDILRSPQPDESPKAEIAAQPAGQGE